MHRGPDRMRQGAKKFHLCAPALAAQRPAAEVLAVVSQQPIAAFAQSRARTLHHFARIELGRIASKSDVAASCEVRERNVLHRSAPPSMREASVVNDATVADVYAVMAVERARSDEVRGDWGLLTGTKKSVAREGLLGTESNAARIVGPPVHGGRRYARARSAAIARWCRTILWNSATLGQDAISRVELAAPSSERVGADTLVLSTAVCRLVSLIPCSVYRIGKRKRE